MKQENVKLSVEQLVKIIVKNCPNAIMLDGLDECIVGVTIGLNQTNVIYSIDKIVNVLMTRDEMSYMDAFEFYDFNIAGLRFTADITPIFVKENKYTFSLN
jgi:hypothetical protein